MIFYTSQLTTGEIQYYLQHIVAPRPVCFASTIDKKGNVNLSPFSFFNLFSTNPPIVIFSPSRRIRDNTTKHTLENISEVSEVVINIVTYDIIHQMSLSSCEYPKGTDEFIKAGFTKEPALMITPPMVKESKAKLECKVVEVKSLGSSGGAGQLVIAEVLCIHINDELFTADQKLDQSKLELVARLGGDWYTKITPDNLFQVQKPNTKTGIGIDALPEAIRTSKILSGNHLAQLANVEAIPDYQNESSSPHVDIVENNLDKENNIQHVHQLIKELIDDNKIELAWQVILKEL